MKKVKLLMPILVVLFIASNICIFSGCKKYPDGPNISFRSKTERVANTWAGASWGSTPIGLTLTKSGSATMNIIGGSASGTWVFQNNKDNINMTFNITSWYFSANSDTIETVTINCSILELKQNKMILSGTFAVSTVPNDPSYAETDGISWTLEGNK
jgi:hypothetical protein